MPKEATKKAGSKKATTKTTTKTKAPAKAKASAAGKKKTRTSFPNDTVIQIVSKEHGYKGNRAKIFGLMRNGQTVEQFREAVKKAKLAGGSGDISLALDRKLIRLSNKGK